MEPISRVAGHTDRDQKSHCQIGTASQNTLVTPGVAGRHAVSTKSEERRRLPCGAAVLPCCCRFCASKTRGMEAWNQSSALMVTDTDQKPLPDR